MNRVLSVLLGTLALLLAGTGIASASTPVPTDTCTVDAPVAGCVNVPGTVDKLLRGVVIPPVNGVCPAGSHDADSSSTGIRCVRDHDGDHNNGHNNGPVRGLPRYNSCGDYNLHGIRDIRRGDARYLDYLDRNRDGIACDNSDNDPVVVGSGDDCSVVTGTLNTYGRDYRSVYDRYNGALNDYRAHRDDTRLRNLSGLYSQYNNFRTRYNDTRNRAVIVCKNTEVPTVTLNVQAPDAACSCSAPAVGNPTSLGSSSGGQVYTTPKGAAEAGNGDDGSGNVLLWSFGVIGLAGVALLAGVARLRSYAHRD